MKLKKLKKLKDDTLGGGMHSASDLTAKAIIITSETSVMKYEVEHMRNTWNFLLLGDTKKILEFFLLFCSLIRIFVRANRKSY